MFIDKKTLYKKKAVQVVGGAGNVCLEEACSDCGKGSIFSGAPFWERLPNYSE